MAIWAGEQMLLWFDSANRDEAVFADASELRFDPSRPRHLGFGFGVHRCLGMHVARCQIAIAFDELLNRVTRLRFVSGSADDVTRTPGITNGPTRLHLTFDPIPDHTGL